MRINIDGVSLLEVKASVAGSYNYYMDITKHASKLFGTGIVERALLEVVSCVNVTEDGAAHITKVAMENVEDALRQICKGDSLLYGDRDLIIKFISGEVVRFCSTENSVAGETAMPDTQSETSKSTDFGALYILIKHMEGGYICVGFVVFYIAAWAADRRPSTGRSRRQWAAV